jgi:hypothetical protein
VSDSIGRFTLTLNPLDATTVHLFTSPDGISFQPARSPVEFGGHTVIALVVWHPRLYATNFYTSAGDLMANADWADVRARTFAFESHLPAVEAGQRMLLNMELVPAFTLTRVIRTGEILTMGYCELNQRDSFWTSFVHLVLFRDAEQKMIQESCDAQEPSGKIPTTILPLIERDWDIDITAYFVLRICRHFHYYRETMFARRWFPCARRAVSYLASLRDQHNVPFARDFWADWKDVRGLSGRLYGPHFVLIVKAAVKEFNWLARNLGEQEFQVTINTESLWNGAFFEDVMRDGSRDGRFHQDQMLAGLWNVCDPEQYETMFGTALSHENSFGLPETQPFYPNSFGYPEGQYHNGGIWPWLSFADAAGRIARGYRDCGRKLLLKVAEADIRTFGDCCVNEYLDGKTGQGGGNEIQGWNACALLPFSLLSDSPKNRLQEYVQEIAGA